MKNLEEAKLLFQKSLEKIQKSANESLICYIEKAISDGSYFLKIDLNTISIHTSVQDKMIENIKNLGFTISDHNHTMIKISGWE